MVSLYDELGADPGASADELHRAYRQRARLLHPDRHAGRSAPELASAQEAMSRLNQAWSVLGDPDARRRYDQERQGFSGIGFSGGEVSDWSDDPPPEAFFAGDDGPPLHGRRIFTAGPAAVLAIIMVVIFIFSAYAGPSATPPPTAPVPTTNPMGMALLGQCLSSQPGIDAVTDCRRPNGGKVIAVPGSGQGCPAGTTIHLLSDQSQVVCLDSMAAVSGRP